MPTILVVDDSAVDRRLVGGLLSKQPEWIIRYAQDGAEALALIDQSAPDLVVTDLVMPEVDGLELVEKVKKKYPLVPLILMTSKGNEEIAVKALQLGAASYSPKSTLARDLVETVRSVLSVSGQQRTSARLLECMTKSECSFVLENDASLIAPLVGYLQDDAMRLGLCDDAERVRVGVALDEALVNALYHGNLELSSELRDSDGRAYHALINQRGEQSPYRDRRIFVDATLSSKEAVINIRDEGPGFDPSNLPDPLEPTNLERMGGRGVLLMRTFMDDVLYNQSGNQVTLIKRASKSSGEQQDGN